MLEYSDVRSAVAEFLFKLGASQPITLFSHGVYTLCLCK